MTTDIQVQFGTDDGEKEYCQAIADLIRAEQHDLADEMLIAGLALHILKSGITIFWLLANDYHLSLLSSSAIPEP